MGSQGKTRLYRKGFLLPSLTSGVRDYILAGLIVIIVSGACYIFTGYIGYQTVSFILLFVVSILSIFMGIGPIALAATLSAFIWNFFFIPPKFTITIDRTEDALMLAMFFIIALVNGILTSRVRRQEKLALEREARTSALYQLTRRLSDSGKMNELICTAGQGIRENFNIEALIMLQDGKNNISVSPGLTPGEKEMAEWVFANAQKAGKFTSKPFSSDYTFYPLQGRNIKPGIMAVKHPRLLEGEELDFWEAFVTQISNAVEREFLNDLARKARFLDESDRLYKTLFNSISHELRIPVATILSGAESIFESSPEGIGKELSYEIFKASNRLNRLIENLLNMSRLESGHITLRPDWCDIHDLINKVTDNLRDELSPFIVKINIAEDMPLVRIDFGLMEQVVHNLLYNAVQYASASKEIEIRICHKDDSMILEVMDRGPGFPEKEIPFIFNKFYRIEGTGTGGTGLGLSIARGFTEAHRGTISASNRKDGGARFIVRIPSEEPQVEIS
jgi:K+-sensing histidine kinase KdpD